MVSPRAIAGMSFCIRLFILCLAIVAMILILVAPGACFSRYLNGQPISREICPGQNSIFPMNADRWSNALHFQGRGENVYGQVALIVITLFLALVTVGISCVHLAIGHNLTYTVSLSYFELFIKDVANTSYNIATMQSCDVGKIAFRKQLSLWSFIGATLPTGIWFRTFPLKAQVSRQLFASGLALIAFLVCGGVETWYATGFDHMSFFIMAVGNGVVSGCAGLPGCQIQFVVKGWAVAAAFYFLAGLLYLIDMGLVFAKKDK
ncbi:hypothetical protein Y032_0760g2118 [Ancylostoma ceylanicum]|nr:hypothetical protein Y032_0760g2118 [Ancylostoma ceylanicum]